MPAIFLRRCLFAVLSCVTTTNVLLGDAIEKLTAQKLEAVRQSVQTLQSERVVIPRSGPYAEYRANLHVHSHWSHDSVGKIEEIVAAARAAGTSILMFTEHPADHYDYFEEGHQGIRDGVLMIPGAEMKGFLVFPTISLRDVDPKSPQDLADLVLGRDGQLFVSHPEERMDWDIQGVTGMEIYNTHADFKDEQGLIAALKNPFRMIGMAQLFARFPQECFAALQNYPADYLRRWDQLCVLAPHTGISANDAHQNVGLAVRWIDGDRGRLEDALGKTLIELDLAVLPDSPTLRKGHQPGDVIFSLFLDRYENSLRHVGSHLLLTDFSASAVRECLKAGRLFVAFDWIADATGFDFSAVSGSTRTEMGSQVKHSTDLQLTAQSPLPVHWRLLRNGEIISESDGPSLQFGVRQPGVYRAEAWLGVAGEQSIWILSNPIYVSGP